MQDEKTVKIIEAVRNMSDREADILEVFLLGFQAGKQVTGKKLKIPAPRGDGEIHAYWAAR